MPALTRLVMRRRHTGSDTAGFTHPLDYSQMTGNPEVMRSWVLWGRKAAKYPRSRLEEIIR
jgi:hypothetical protein